MRNIDSIVLHTAASYDPERREVVHMTRDAIDAYHREHNGWRLIGYHWYVEEDGKGVRGRVDSDVGAHVGGFNEHSLGLCVSGHGDFAPWNAAQESEVLRKLRQWIGIYRVPIERIIGHREAGRLGAPPVRKTCPGLLIDLEAIRAKLEMQPGKVV